MRQLFICLMVCCSHVAWAAVTPTCLTLSPGLIQSTYDTTGYTSSPASAAEFQSIITTYATDALRFGTGTVSNINGNGNPYGNQEDYLNIIDGYIYIDTPGNYQFAVDGDDAVEVIIDGTVVSSFYGLHAQNGAPTNPGTITLDVGYHEITFHHHERTGQDTYYLYWQRPGDAGLSIVPPTVLESCYTLDYESDVPLSCATASQGVWLNTYDKNGYGHPNNASDYQTLVDNYAIASLLCGAGQVARIDSGSNGIGSATNNNNPFTCATSGNSQDNYLAVFTGYINVPADGLYEFGINGDDAVELLINGTVVSGWYGGHGAFSGGSQPNPAYNTALALEAGYHLLEFRMEEVGGGDNYFLFWRKPTDTGFSIIGSTDPNELQYCPRNVLLSLQKNVTVIDDPVNGTAAPKSIPGAIAIYTLDVTNSGNRSPDVDSVRIADPIPDNVEMYVDNYDGTGQSVKFIDTNDSGLTLTATSIRYSSIGDPTCSDNYTPISTGGYDANVDYLCVTPGGIMNFDELTASGFRLEFQTRIR